MAEESKPDRKPPWFFLPAIVILGIALAALAYLLTMQSAGWRTGSRHGGPIIAFSPSDADIYLLDSYHSRKYFSSVGGNYSVILDEWRHFFDARKISYADIQSSDLLKGLKPGVLVLPSAVALESDEREAIRKFEDEGGSVLATWATGVRGGDGQWRGWEFLQNHFAVAIKGEIGKQNSENVLFTLGETPLTVGIAAGKRIKLEQTSERPLNLAEGRNVAALFMDSARTPVDDHQGIVFDEANGSRRVLLAFSETAWHGQQADVYLLLAGIVDWLRHKPASCLAAWPYPYRGAFIPAMESDRDAPNSRHYADLLKENHISGTFYFPPAVAAQNQPIVRAIETANEIALLTETGESFKGVPKQAQAQRLEKMTAQMQATVADPAHIQGLRIPAGLYDSNTETLLPEKGLTHLLTDRDNALLPHLAKNGPQNPELGLILLPRAGRDDTALLQAGLSGKVLTQAMKNDFDLALQMGALGSLDLHSANFASGSDLDQATKEFLHYAKSKQEQVWMAPARQINEWWRERSRLRYELSGEAKHMSLDVSIAEPGSSQPLAIVILNQARGEAPTITATKVGMPLPEITAIDDFSSAIVFKDIPPGDYNYYLSF